MQADVWQADYVDAALATVLAQKADHLFVTIHDAIPFVYAPSRWGFRVYRYQLAQAFRRARAVVTVSEHARQEVLKHTSAAPERVFAVHNGIDHQRYYPASSPVENEIFTIKYLGGLGVPHKNALALLQTAQVLREQNVSFRMEIGGYLPDHHPLRQYAEKHQLSEVHFVGFVPDEAMRSFYQTADLFLFPSLLEGFGFPPLEAMACGVPAVVSDIPVLREVLQDAAIYAEPTPEAYARAIRAAMDEPALLVEKRQQALAQACRYTWEKTAQQMIHLYTDQS
jgi:glycosyltransferase involved in cell wall biosynthesis